VVLKMRYKEKILFKDIKRLVGGQVDYYSEYKLLSAPLNAPTLNPLKSAHLQLSSLSKSRHIQFPPYTTGS